MALALGLIAVPLASTLVTYLLVEVVKGLEPAGAPEKRKH